MILAIDAGFTACGWAVLNAGQIVSAGCIRTERSDRKHAVRVADDDAERCQQIARELAAVIRANQVRGIIAELPHAGAKGARAIACMAKAGAVVAVLAELLQLPAEYVTPMAVKKITGDKKATKEDVEAAVLMRWPDAPLSQLKCEREHMADALAAYIAGENGNLVRMLKA